MFFDKKFKVQDCEDKNLEVGIYSQGVFQQETSNHQA